MYNNEIIRLVRNCETAFVFLNDAKKQKNDIKYHYWMNSLLHNISQMEKILDLVDGMIAPEYAIVREYRERAEEFIGMVR